MPQDTHKEWFMEGDQEAARLRILHKVHKDAQGGRLVLAPVDFSKSDLTILDSGTSDGTWLFDLRSQIFPSARSHSYIGTDISRERFPKEYPQDMNYRIQDINSPWPEFMNGTIDLVHQRLVLGSAGKNVETAVKRLCELVKPGGWIQLVEAEQVVAEDDGPAMHQFLAIVSGVFEAMGAGVEFQNKLRDWIEEAGFVNTGMTVAPSSIGAKVSDETLRKPSINAMIVALNGLVGFVKKQPDFKGLTSEELDTFIPRYVEEVDRQGGCYPLRIVWGQKPA